MPNKKNAEKALRQSKTRQVRNDKARNAIYDIKRKIKKAVAEESVKDLDKLLKEAQVLLDKAVKKNIIKKNAAARKKSSLASMVNKKALPVKAKKTIKKATAKKVVKKVTTKNKKK